MNDRMAALILLVTAIGLATPAAGQTYQIQVVQNMAGKTRDWETGYIIWCRTPVKVSVGGKMLIHFDRGTTAAGPQGQAIEKAGTCAWESIGVDPKDPNIIEVYPLTEDGGASSLTTAQVERRALQFNFLTPEVLFRPNARVGIAIEAVAGPYGPAQNTGVYPGTLYFRATHSGMVMTIIP